MKRVIALVLVLIASTAHAAPAFVGTWAAGEKWCKLLKSGKLGDMDEAHSSPSGMFTVDEKGNMEWQHAAQSCRAKKLTTNGDSFKIEAVCEYRGVEDVKSNITGRVSGGELKLTFSDKNFPVYGDVKYTKCE